MVRLIATLSLLLAVSAGAAKAGLPGASSHSTTRAELSRSTGAKRAGTTPPGAEPSPNRTVFIPGSSSSAFFHGPAAESNVSSEASSSQTSPGPAEAASSSSACRPC